MNKQQIKDLQKTLPGLEAAKAAIHAALEEMEDSAEEDEDCNEEENVDRDTDMGMLSEMEDSLEEIIEQLNGLTSTK